MKNKPWILIITALLSNSVYAGELMFEDFSAGGPVISQFEGLEIAYQRNLRAGEQTQVYQDYLKDVDSVNNNVQAFHLASTRLKFSDTNSHLLDYPAAVPFPKILQNEFNLDIAETLGSFYNFDNSSLGVNNIAEGTYSRKDFTEAFETTKNNLKGHENQLSYFNGSPGQRARLQNSINVHRAQLDNLTRKNNAYSYFKKQYPSLAEEFSSDIFAALSDSTPVANFSNILSKLADSSYNFPSASLGVNDTSGDKVYSEESYTKAFNTTNNELKRLQGIYKNFRGSKNAKNNLVNAIAANQAQVDNLTLKNNRLSIFKRKYPSLFEEFSSNIFAGASDSTSVANFSGILNNLAKSSVVSPKNTGSAREFWR